MISSESAKALSLRLPNVGPVWITVGGCCFGATPFDAVEFTGGCALACAFACSSSSSSLNRWMSKASLPTVLVLLAIEVGWFL